MANSALHPSKCYWHSLQPRWPRITADSGDSGLILNRSWWCSRNTLPCVCTERLKLASAGHHCISVQEFHRKFRHNGSKRIITLPIFFCLETSNLPPMRSGLLGFMSLTSARWDFQDMMGPYKKKRSGLHKREALAIPWIRTCLKDRPQLARQKILHIGQALNRGVKKGRFNRMNVFHLRSTELADLSSD